MLSDGGRFVDLIKCPRPSVNFCMLSAAILLLQSVCLHSSVAFPTKCHREGSALNCSRMSVERIPEGLNFQGVESLVLTSNRMVELRLTDIAKLPPTLKRLDLSINKLKALDFELLDARIKHLQELILSRNQLRRLRLVARKNNSELDSLDLSHNLLEEFVVKPNFTKLQKLDLKFNRLEHLPVDAFRFMPILRHLDLSGNPIHAITDFTFDGLGGLRVLYLNFMPSLSEVSRRSLAALGQLRLLEMRGNPLLKVVDLMDLPPESRLLHLDLSSSSIEQLNFPDELADLSFLNVSDIKLRCDCDSLRSLHALHSVGQKKLRFNLFGFSCIDDTTNTTYRALNDAIRGLSDECHSGLLTRTDVPLLEIIAQLGKPLLVRCLDPHHSINDVLWLTNRKEVVTRRSTDLERLGNLTSNNTAERISVLPDGSLAIEAILQRDGGRFVCLPRSLNGMSLSPTAFVVKLDYGALSRASLHSMIVGSATAGAFFVVAVLFGSARYAGRACSTEERRKRKSIREILDKMNGFKAQQMDRFSAYRSAKMDQLLAFKSATIDQLSAFKTARVDKLRTYKQATVTTILGHMDRMREHYASQTNRIKENCSQQVDKLRETYEAGCGRLKDYRFQRVERMRENYGHQVCRIREYGIQQVSRLREQYKMQQQYLLKLLELIDVGNCVNVIEAECLRTESVIFDADITFDLEPRPIRMPGASGEGAEDQERGGAIEGVDDEEEDDVEKANRLELERVLEELCSFDCFADQGACGDGRSEEGNDPLGSDEEKKKKKEKRDREGKKRRKKKRHQMSERRATRSDRNADDEASDDALTPLSGGSARSQGPPWSSVLDPSEIRVKVEDLKHNPPRFAAGQTGSRSSSPQQHCTFYADQKVDIEVDVSSVHVEVDAEDNCDSGAVVHNKEAI